MDEERSYERLDDLFNLFVLPSVSKLASELKTDVDTLMRVYARKEPISDALKRQLIYLWAIKFGTAYYPAPESVLESEIETVEKSSAFFYRDMLYGKKDHYKDIVFWDILPDFISEQEYDNALTRVRNRIIPVVDEMYKTLYIQPTSNISFVTLYGPERRANRTFELHIIEREARDTETPRYKIQYGLSYSQGEIQVGDIPEDKADTIAYILKTEGYWEL